MPSHHGSINGVTIEAGTQVNEWLITGRLGDGGVAVVYRARHRYKPEHLPVAIKFLVNNEDDRRFQRERRLMERIHPNIVGLLDFGSWNDKPYLVLELMDTSLSTEVNNRRMAGEVFTIPEACWIIIQAVQGLRAAHVVHRDLKPDNLLLKSPSGARRPAFIPGDLVRGTTVKVADFGLAKAVAKGVHISLTMKSHAMGTPCYMPPEQCIDTHNVGIEGDIYSLGIILYELFAFRTPFENATADDPSMAYADVVAIMKAHVHNQVIYPDTIPALIRSILERCLAKDPRDRFRSLRMFEDALRAAAGLPPSRQSENTDVPTQELPAQQTQAAQTAPQTTSFFRRLFGR